MADIYSLTIRADTRDVTRARQALAGLSDGSVKATRATQQLQVATQRSVRRGFTPMRGAVQQAGFQIGDFAVQVGAGQNALVAFAQQGSQLAGIFGPGGAVIGAVIAIGGAIAGGFARSMGEGGESVEELAEKTKQLTEELGRATDAQARFVRGQFAQQAAEQRDIIKDQQEELEFLNIRIERFIETNRRVGVPLDKIKANGAYLSLAEQAEEAQVRIDNANSALEAGDLSLQEYEDAISGVGGEAGTTAEKLDSMIQSIQSQADTLGLSARETALYEAARLGASAADIQAINNSFDLIESYRQQKEATKGAAAANQSFEQSWVRLQDKIDPIGADLRQFGQDVAVIQDAFARGIITDEQADQMVNSLNKVGEASKASGQGLEMFTESQQKALGAVGQIFGNMAEIAEKGGKDQFDTWKAMASAQAAVNTALAISNALAIPPPPVGIALASTIGALGAVQVAQIQATEYQGTRQMGGSVSAGGRYLVGENGPEIVTMGGSGVVTPSSVMGTGEPSMPNITVNMIEDNARSGQVEQRRRDDGSVEINAFVSDITSGGRRAKVMESVYGLRRQGR